VGGGKTSAGSTRPGPPGGAPGGFPRGGPRRSRPAAVARQRGQAVPAERCVSLGWASPGRRDPRGTWRTTAARSRT